MIAFYSSFDGIALRQCREYNSDYSWVTLYATIAAALGPLIASITIQDAAEGSNDENNYMTAYYVSDGLYLIGLVTSCFLKVNLPKKEEDTSLPVKRIEKMKNSFQEAMKLFSPPTLIFFGMIFQGGIMWGVKDTYFAVYLQQDLEASSQFIGYVNTISVVSGVLILPFAKWIIEGIGHVHICYLAIMIDVARLVISSYAK